MATGCSIKISKNIYRGPSEPSWHQWINYETDSLNKDDLIGLILESQAFSIEQREAYESVQRSQAAAERLKLKADIAAINEVNRIMKLAVTERESALKSLREKYDSFMKSQKTEKS